MNMRALLSSENFHKAMVFLGVIGSVITIIMGWGGMDFLVRTVVKKMLRLVPGSITWNMWKTIPIPVYLKFNIFNITNPEEMSQGAKPQVNEMGPYVYIIDYDKHNFVPNEDDDTYVYQDSKTYFFVPEMSNGREDDMVTYINLIFVGVSHVAHDFTDVDFILETLDTMLTEKGEKLYRTDKVKDLFFDGVSIQAYIELLDDPLVQQAGEIDLPEDFKDGKFALFKGKNGTLDAWWEVHAGIRDHREFGQLVAWQNKSKLTFHKADSCNSINGSDGTLNPPFVEPGITDIFIFIPELCRSVKWQYDRETITHGIPVSRFQFPDIKTPAEDPDLWCFCPHDDLGKCDIHGIASLAACYQGVPIMFSKPHFLDVDTSVRKQIDGVNPDQKKHGGFIDIHALTGVTIQASVTMQLSIELVNWPSMPSFANASRAFVPFAWIQQEATIDALNMFLIRMQSTFLGLWPFLRWLNLFGCLGLVGIGGLLVYNGRKGSSTVDITEEENKEGEVDKELNVWIKKFVK
ncbi:unnamed protein product [Orchesella dallaii]|uniref:Scavenger receptor class B member 1 n=1 Tax=Orchesella dallaii TaxID=48710 RepID=A0ABP1PWB2_9HEXA